MTISWKPVGKASDTLTAEIRIGASRLELMVSDLNAPGGLWGAWFDRMYLETYVSREAAQAAALRAARQTLATALSQLGDEPMPAVREAAAKLKEQGSG